MNNTIQSYAVSNAVVAWSALGVFAIDFVAISVCLVTFILRVYFSTSRKENITSTPQKNYGTSTSTFSVQISNNILLGQYEKSFSHLFFFLVAVVSTICIMLRTLSLLSRMNANVFLYPCQGLAWIWDMCLFAIMITYMIRSWRLIIAFDWGTNRLLAFNEAFKAQVCLEK